MKDQDIIALYNARDERAIAETQSKYGGYCTSIAQNILQKLFEFPRFCGTIRQDMIRNLRIMKNETRRERPWQRAFYIRLKAI